MDRIIGDVSGPHIGGNRCVGLGHVGADLTELLQKNTDCTPSKREGEREREREPSQTRTSTLPGLSGSGLHSVERTGKFLKNWKIIIPTANCKSTKKTKTRSLHWVARPPVSLQVGPIAL